MAGTTHVKWTDGCTDRINRLRDEYWNNRPEIDIERAVTYTRVYKETEAEETCIRRAKALLAYMSEKSLVIGSDELIVGTGGKKHRAAVVCPDVCWRWVEGELDTMSTRPQDPYIISEEDKKILREEIFPYWNGRSMDDYFLANLNDEQKNVGVDTNIVFGDVKSQSGSGEFPVGFDEIIMKKGFKGVQEEAQAHLDQIDMTNPEDYDKAKFYESVIISCNAAKILGERYGEHAAELAKKETDPKRKEELLQIAADCSKVPFQKPETFRQAVQTVWFTEILIWAEENNQAVVIGRPDQYLYPFYKKDLEEGRITKEEAQEILECLWIKMAEMIYLTSIDTAAYYAGYSTFHGLTLGGVTKDNKDAVNDLTYMMLQCTMDLRMSLPVTQVRINDKNPQEYLAKIYDLVKCATGQPAIIFDRIVIPLLERRGVSHEDALGWSVGGCIEPQVPGKTYMWAEGCRYNYPTAVEWALSDGYSKYWDRQIGLKTGDPKEFKTFEEFIDAVKKQIAYMVRISVGITQVAEKAHMLRMPKPIRSICTSGCIESGRDVVNGGAEYNYLGLEVTGAADMADSVAAVKKFVYDDKLITMEELIKALEDNFEGHEVLRQRLINEAPKYGNDEDEVDMLARELVAFSCDEAEKYKGLNGQSFISGLIPVMANVPHGEVVPALPSGRKEWEALADGASPYMGYDQNGPTAVMKSVCKLDHRKNGNGALLNMKLSPSLMKTESDKKNFQSLLRTVSDLEGYHVQFNVVDAKTLKAAQERPDEYRDLLVRVAGYSAYFTELRPDAQKSIIDRTEQSAW